MNRSSIIVASVAILLIAAMFGGAAWAQFGGTFDRGSCAISCMDRYGGPAGWTGDRSRTENFSYSMCAQQCDTRYLNDLDRRGRGLGNETR